MARLIMSAAPLARPVNEVPILPPPKSALRRWAPVIVGLILVVGAITFVTRLQPLPAVLRALPVPGPGRLRGGRWPRHLPLPVHRRGAQRQFGHQLQRVPPGPLRAGGEREPCPRDLPGVAAIPLQPQLGSDPGQRDRHLPSAFPGAGFSNATRFSGLAPGSQAEFSFWTNATGSYRYICEVPGHYEAGMFGFFNVSAHPAAAVPSGRASRSPPPGTPDGQGGGPGPLTVGTAQSRIPSPVTEKTASPSGRLGESTNRAIRRGGLDFLR